MLDAFGLQQGGTQYRHLVGAFQRIFGATIFFGTDTQRAKAAVIHQARFNFMSEARIWYARDPGQQTLPGECQNEIVLSTEFYDEIMAHPVPADLEAAEALSSAPAALDLFMWISYRCFTAWKRSECRFSAGWRISWGVSGTRDPENSVNVWRFGCGLFGVFGRSARHALVPTGGPRC